MKCIHCGAKRTHIYNSRQLKDGHHTWRRHACGECKKEFTTYERPDLSWLEVDAVSKTPKTTAYSRAKLMLSLVRATDDDIRAIDIDNLIDTIELKLIALQKPRIQTRELALCVASTLQPISAPVYVRYATKHLKLSAKMIRNIL